ncbi:atpase family aaa domain-containing protein 1-a [Diplodia corticola]|uniref:Atpase family aaa domain-containing protein 1-a n=1 Tax=Diplodia corticola TaxID=236234 RepID=A0A1J9R7T9_9PEZI|nr:atpase family aaa domain-containing protein 1-a [Diplodia corticola]OJD36656.1 atpase family aaa domain-containing protein 1-a [Diplodia corticola]
MSQPQSPSLDDCSVSQYRRILTPDGDPASTVTYPVSISSCDRALHESIVPVDECSTAADATNSEHTPQESRDSSPSSQIDSSPNVNGETSIKETTTHADKMADWERKAKGEEEETLLANIVNIDSILPNYEQISIDQSIIRQLESVTKLALKRPKAFSHGVLVGNKITGAILYGPPGTGKTLLVKALAKQSGFNMLSISSADIWRKHWGEDEQMIRATFSLARKIKPCIIFIDEADAMLGVRKEDEQRHVRAYINLFLMEWDGLVSDIESPFILLATNRPLDLDPAVLRRAPVKIQLGIPTEAERCKILELLLTGEDLHPDINPKTLAKRTPYYTGSDLKNLCVASALECVREQQEDSEKRQLQKRHFEAAIAMIRATKMDQKSANQYDSFSKRPTSRDPPSKT